MTDNSSNLNKVHEFYHSGKIEQTLELCDQLLLKVPIQLEFKAQLLRRKGDCFHKQGKLLDALALYDEALSLTDQSDHGMTWILESKASIELTTRFHSLRENVDKEELQQLLQQLPQLKS